MEQNTVNLFNSNKKIYLDISATFRSDLKTGIERVARAISIALLKSPPKNYDIKIVYLDFNEHGWCYMHAHRYTSQLLNLTPQIIPDTKAILKRDDIVLTLDISNHFILAAESKFFFSLMSKGVQVYSIVYDLLPILTPHVFPPKADVNHSNWLNAVKKMTGAICISQSVANDLQDWYTKHKDESNQSFKILVSHLGADIKNSAPTKEIPENAESILRLCTLRPTFIMVGTIEPRKGHALVIDAFSDLWSKGLDINLILIGKEGWGNIPNNMRRNIPDIVNYINLHSEQDNRLLWLKHVSDIFLEKIYEKASCLIIASENEGFGLPLIEAAQYGLPIIAHDIPVFREVAGKNAFYFKGSSKELTDAIISWIDLYKTHNIPDSKLINWLTWDNCAKNIIHNLTEEPQKKHKLYVDISIVYKNDYRTGIQRVTRSILLELSKDKSITVIPVYLNQKEKKYSYNELTLHIDDQENISYKDSNSEISPSMGDILLCLDLSGSYITEAYQQGLFNQLKTNGITTHFVIYDLLPIKIPHCFLEEDIASFIEWLSVTTTADSVLCISQSVANDYNTWFNSLPAYMKNNEINISYFHLGGDISQSLPSKGLPKNWQQEIENIKSYPCFLMVGTIEPRKGYQQVLKAFELLWKTGTDLNLVIVGKEGWMTSNFCESLRTHPEKNHHLFWFDDISDEYLEKLYNSLSCLIAASEDEGFGLPLIEAARHNLPIIARDTPIFREIAGDHAYYFYGFEADKLATKIINWLDIHDNGLHPKSNEIPWMTWTESTSQLKKIILEA